MSDAGTVQKMLYETLTASLLPLSVAVYDHVPQNAPFPYVAIDSQDVLPNDYLLEAQDVRRIYLSVWSRYRGQKNLHEIYQNIYNALHAQILPLDSGEMVECEVERYRSDVDRADGLTYIGRVTLKITTE